MDQFQRLEDGLPNNNAIITAYVNNHIRIPSNYLRKQAPLPLHQKVPVFYLRILYPSDYFSTPRVSPHIIQTIEYSNYLMYSGSFLRSFLTANLPSLKASVKKLLPVFTTSSGLFSVALKP